MAYRSVFRLLSLAAVVTSSCGEDTVVQSGLTGVEVRVRHDGALGLDQLLFTGRDSITGERLFAPTSRPEEPESLGDGESSVAILLADDLGGRRVVVRADGLVQSVVVASAFEQIDLEAKRIVEVTLTLGALIECGDGSITSIAEACDDGNTDPGDGCDQTCSVEQGFTCDGEPSLCNQCGNDVCDTRENGCNCPNDCPNAPTCFPGQRCVNDACVCDNISCPSGCCAGVICVSSGVGTCGVDGDVCIDCSVAGDSCTATGVCDCSGNPVCGTGEHCVVGTCICDNVGCAAGCCEGNTCTPPSVAACGTGGSSCRACNTDRADACLDGVCRCGLGNGCSVGQECVDGNCACNASSCPTGCCAGTSCSIPEFNGCGTAGADCAPCDVELADDCIGGVCTCGGAAACVAGQRCSKNGCVCDSVSCPSGCCNAGTCETASASACGTDGRVCVDCGLGADTCDATGACLCGTNTPCLPGQECISGACQCTPTSCPDGCCAGSTCRAATPATCGTGGGTCSDCGVLYPGKADTCTDGQCRCGVNEPCGAGESCQGDSCIAGCDSSVCGNGCCSGASCTDPPTDGACGTNGVICVDCIGSGAGDACNGSECTCGVGGACPPGQQCLSGTCECNATSCPSGCCDASDQCVTTSAIQCGAPGATCTDCGIVADRCTPSGACECGTTGSVCSVGQQCIDGACECNGTSCPTGCCVADVCTIPDLASCGISGNVCVPCDSARSDACTNGACECNGAAACSVGESCETGGCACDPATCTGCCDGTGCHLSGFATCGEGGTACVACDSAIADDCIAGACTCGGDPACAADEACSAGSCVPICNPTSCAGCCSGSTCVTATDENACGASGGQCIPCDPLTADGCATGACTCGGLTACTGGETCQLGVCAPPPCSIFTCPNGCCDFVGQCRAGDHKFWCGTGAIACVDCVDQGLRCINQSCQ